MKIMGIDPGKNGGICILDQSGEVLTLIKMPATPSDLYNFLVEHSDCNACVLEKVGGMPGNGGSAMFNFGKGYGWLEMALIACKIKTVTVTPQKWQKYYQLGSSSSCTHTEWKNKLKAKAQQLFPSLGKEITLVTCDAMLIAEYGRNTL